MYIFTKALTRMVMPCLIIGLVSAKLKAQDSLATPAAATLEKRADALTVNGYIKDATTGKGIDGINIAVEGFSASITDSTGAFKVAVPNYNAVLLVSGQGFQSKEIALKSKTSVSTVLYEDTFTSVYDEVALPLSNKRYNHITGSVKSVTVNDSWQRASENPETYLQGRITGLNTVRRSGTPGIGANMFLRGYTSLFTNNKPLIVIDGILYDNNDYGISLLAGHVDNPLGNIDVKDIDNITVVKDATASVYGTKAANGVILITTLRAKEQATKIDFSVYGGYNAKPANIPVLGAADYRTYLSEALNGYYLGQGYTALQSQSMIQAMPYMNDDSSNPSYYRFHNDTDWQSRVLKGSFNQNYYLKVTGGDNIATYGLTVGYLNNKGMTRNTELERYQTRFNADLNLTNKFKGVANLSFVSNEQNLRDQGLAYNTNPIYLALTKSPFLGSNEISETGTISPNIDGIDSIGTGFRSNPAAAVEDMRGVNKNYRFMGSLGFNYEFNKKLNLQVLGGITFSKVRESIFIPNNGIVRDTLDQGIVSNRSGSNVERLYSLFTDTRLSYKTTLNNIHNISSNIGFRFNDSKMEADYGLGYNSATDDYVTVGQGQIALRKINGMNGDWRWLNMYANAEYELKNKYFLAFNMAVDGSSRFGKQAEGAWKINGNSFAVLPSVSAGWLLSSEPFLANAKALEILKLRASYGLVGNDEIGNYTAKQYYVSQNFLGFQGLVRGNIANPGLKWETVEKLNLGIDASFLNERLNMSIDLFKNNTRDMLTQQPLYTFTGFDYTLTNNGAMSSKGIELGLAGRILKRSVKWDMNINVSTYRTELTKIPGDRSIFSYAGGTILSQKGQEANLFYGYRTKGVYATTAAAAASGLTNRKSDGSVTQFQGGDMIFQNLNGDQYIDENDMEVIGNPNPDFTGMIGNTISWKRFSFDAIFTFSVGNDIYNFVRRDLESMDGSQNQTKNILSRWRTEGQVTDVPRASIGDPNGNSRFSDRWIEDGSYLRLRTISVAYNLPIKASALKYARVYVTGNNVFTLTKYLGYDPEFSASGGVFTQGVDTGLEPQVRTIQLGVRIGL